MRKFALIFTLLLVILSGVSVSTIMYKKKQSLDIPKDFKDKLIEAHKSIIFFNYDKANKLYLAAIEQSSSNKVLEEYLAFLISQEDLNKAYKIAGQILKYNPNHFLANMTNTAYLIKKNRLAAAINNIKVPAQDTNSLNNAVYAILSTINFFINKQTVQFEDFAAQIKAQLPEFYYNQLVLYNILVKNYKQALEASKYTIKNYPNTDNIIVHSKLIFLKDKANGINTFKDYLGGPFLTNKAINYYINNFSINSIDVPYVVSDALYRISQYMSPTLVSAYIKPDNILIAHLALMINENNPLARMMVASYYMKLGDYNTALSNLNKISKQNFYYRLLYLEISKILVDLGQFHKAVETLSNVYNTDPTNPEPLLELGHLYYKISSTKEYKHKQYVKDKVINYYTEALNVAESNNLTLGKWLAYYFRGIANNSFNNWHAAESDLVNAFKINNNDPILLNYLGYSWIDRGTNIDKGINLVKIALVSEPDNPHFLDSYAWGLFKKGNYNDALKISLNVLKKLPLDYSINHHLGDIYWKLGDKNKAKNYWSSALNMDPDAQTRYSLDNKLKGKLPIYLINTSAG